MSKERISLLSNTKLGGASEAVVAAMAAARNEFHDDLPRGRTWDVEHV